MEGFLNTHVYLQRATSNMKQIYSAFTLSAGTQITLNTQQIQIAELQQASSPRRLKNNTWSTHITEHV